MIKNRLILIWVGKGYFTLSSWFSLNNSETVKVFIFCKIISYYLWKYKFYRPCVQHLASRLLQISNKLFSCCHVSFVKFSYWSKFYVNIITGSIVKRSFLYKRLAWNPEIGNILIWILLDIWRLRQIRYTKFGTNVSNKMLLNTA